MIHRPTDEEVLRYGRDRGWPPMRGGSDFALLDGLAYDPVGELETTTTGTAVAAASAALTKGAWVQLGTTPSRQATGLCVFLCHSGSATAHGVFQVDIGIGAAGSELVVAPNLMVSLTSSVISGGMSYILPLSLPPGVRLSARSQSTVASSSLNVYVGVMTSGFAAPVGFSRMISYGYVQLTTPSAVHTKTAWQQLSASTEPSNAMIVAHCIQPGGAQTAQMLDVAVGAAGSEVPVVSDLYVPGPLGTTQAVNQNWLLPVQWNWGARVAVRYQASSNITVDAPYVSVYTFI